MSVAETTCFVPGRFLVKGKGESDHPDDSNKPDLLILNQPIASLDVLAKLWKHSRYRLCADGGANRLFDLLRGESEHLRDNFVRADSVVTAINRSSLLTPC
jgi:thiamine pyrophosphokinase